MPLEAVSAMIAVLLLLLNLFAFDVLYAYPTQLSYTDPVEDCTETINIPVLNGAMVVALPLAVNVPLCEKYPPVTWRVALLAAYGRHC